MDQLHAPDRTVTTHDGTYVVCACTWTTPTFPSVAEAMRHIEQAHPLTTPRCMLCERERLTLPGARFRGLHVLTDPSTGEQFLVCTDTTTCRRLTRRMVDRLHETAQSASLSPTSRQRHLRVVR